MFTLDLQCYGCHSIRRVLYLLYNMPNPNRYHSFNIVTTKIIVRCIKSDKGSLFFIRLFTLQTCDYMLHYHKDTTSITQQKSITSTQNLPHMSFHQTFTKDPLIHPQTLTNNASTSSSFNMCKPKQDLNVIYIMEILCQLLPDPHLMPQRALPNPSSQVLHKSKAQQINNAIQKSRQDICKPKSHRMLDNNQAPVDLPPLTQTPTPNSPKTHK